MIDDSITCVCVDAVMTMRYADAAAALGVAVDTPMDEVKKAYFRLAMKVRASRGWRRGMPAAPG